MTLATSYASIGEIGASDDSGRRTHLRRNGVKPVKLKRLQVATLRVDNANDPLLYGKFAATSRNVNASTVDGLPSPLDPSSEPLRAPDAKAQSLSTLGRQCLSRRYGGFP